MMNNNNKPVASIIITSKNEGHNLKQTIEHIGVAKTNVNYEIIVIDDGSTDNSSNFLQDLYDDHITLITTKGLGPAGARNLGVKSARGEILVFLDAHMIPSKYWLDKLISCFEDPAISVISPVIGGFNPSHPDIYGLILDHNLQPRWVSDAVEGITPVPLVGGAGLTMRAQTFEEIEGFDEGFRIMGLEDIDLCMRLWMQGYSVYLYPEVRILHKFRNSKPYPVLNENIVYNYLRLAFKLFNEERITRVIDICKKNENFGRIMMDIIGSDVWEQRLALNNKCKYNDDWFFSYFNMDSLS